MIVEFIFNVIFSIIIGVISLFPTLPSINFDYFNGIVRVLSLVDMFVSLRVFASCVVIILVVYNARLIWSVVMWVIRKLPGVS